MAGGVDGVVVLTDLIKNRFAADGINDWDFYNNGGINMGRNGGENPTLADGSQITTYFDAYKGGSDWRVSLQQLVELEAGKYRLAVYARGAEDLNFYRLIAATGVENNDQLACMVENTCEYDNTTLTFNGNQGGTFGRGWELDYLDFEVETAGKVCIAVQAFADSNRSGKWISFTGFTLVKFGQDGEELALQEPALFVDGVATENATVINASKTVNITFGEMPEGYEIYYKWVAASEEAPALDEDSFASFSKYTEAVALSTSGTFSYFAKLGNRATEVKSFEVKFSSSVDSINAAGNEAAEYFNLNGVRVDADRLEAGIYIKRAGSKVSKVVVK